jgi:hypothetical protein
MSRPAALLPSAASTPSSHEPPTVCFLSPLALPSAQPPLLPSLRAVCPLSTAFTPNRPLTPLSTAFTQIHRGWATLPSISSLQTCRPQCRSGKPFFSIVLWALVFSCRFFRACFLCFQQLAASFCKTPGWGTSDDAVKKHSARALAHPILAVHESRATSHIFANSGGGLGWVSLREGRRELEAD